MRAPVLAILYDIHGNTDALDAVLAEAEAARADRYLLGGDYGTPSPAPLETLARLRALPNATWIRGNGERWLREPPDLPEVREAYTAFEGAIPEEEVEWLYNLPPQADLDGILCVHGCPIADDESFPPAPHRTWLRLARDGCVE
jgi:hypothetical protein